jgi:hypothetical protein
MCGRAVCRSLRSRAASSRAGAGMISARATGTRLSHATANWLFARRRRRPSRDARQATRRPRGRSLPASGDAASLAQYPFGSPCLYDARPAPAPFQITEPGQNARGATAREASRPAAWGRRHCRARGRAGSA